MGYRDFINFDYLGQYKYKDIYSNILKTAKVYDYLQEVNINFDYSYNEHDIDSIKKEYDIDSLRENTELQTFINATNWVSNILESNKESTRPIGNSSTIIHDVVNGKYAASCYTYAVVLNDILCALGYKCKYVFCYPIALHCVDCHVVNLVYSDEFGKWILLDSAQNIYFTDENNMMLNLEELRKKLILDLPVVVHLLDTYKSLDDKKKTIIKQKILTYMTKNLYRFGCFQNSQKDRLKVNSVVYFYHLVPCTFMQTACQFSNYTHGTNIKMVEIFNMNPNIYWGVPTVENNSRK